MTLKKKQTRHWWTTMEY